MNTNQLMSRLALLREFVLGGSVLVLVGCPDAAGRPCDGPPNCPSGYSCVTAVLDTATQCLPTCERRSDCAAGEACVRSYSSPPTCDRYGSGVEGAECFEGPDSCGPGLRCAYTDIFPTCRPNCEYQSPHSEDRICPAGTVCEMTGTNVCVDLCDPLDPNACAATRGESCVRYSHPTLGVIGACFSRGAWQSCDNGLRCTGGQVCAEGACHDPVDAPALPWPIAQDAAPLVD
jgi:hypothetical protein